MREIRLRQFHIDGFAVLIEIMNAGNRVAWDVNRDGSANFFPAVIPAPAVRRGRP